MSRPDALDIVSVPRPNSAATPAEWTEWHEMRRDARAYMQKHGAGDLLEMMGLDDLNAQPEPEYGEAGWIELGFTDDTGEHIAVQPETVGAAPVGELQPIAERSPAPVAEPADRPRLKGLCRLCDRSVGLRGDGRLLRHKNHLAQWCDGAARMPKPPEPES
jgi:hypothetical protein